MSNRVEAADTAPTNRYQVFACRVTDELNNRVATWTFADSLKMAGKEADAKALPPGAVPSA